MPTPELLKRQYYYYYTYDPWYYWIRWVVLGGILLLVLLFLLLAYCHARRRVKKGQPPMQYHAWMIPYGQRAHLYETGYVNQGNQYPLGTYPNQAPAPIYQPNQGAWDQNHYPPYVPEQQADGAPSKY